MGPQTHKARRRACAQKRQQQRVVACAEATQRDMRSRGTSDDLRAGHTGWHAHSGRMVWHAHRPLRVTYTQGAQVTTYTRAAQGGTRTWGRGGTCGDISTSHTGWQTHKGHNGLTYAQSTHGDRRTTTTKNQHTNKYARCYLRRRPRRGTCAAVTHVTTCAQATQGGMRTRGAWGDMRGV